MVLQVPQDQEARPAFLEAKEPRAPPGRRARLALKACRVSRAKPVLRGCRESRAKSAPRGKQEPPDLKEKLALTGLQVLRAK
jgi:hypothetical protein